jgi:hypothetical protein
VECEVVSSIKLVLFNYYISNIEVTNAIIYCQDFGDYRRGLGLQLGLLKTYRS